MKSELEEFASSFGLSPREKEVVALLANRVVHFKDIAAQLKLSPSTVNNHFKSIFEKTGTHSKSQLLATFLRHLIIKLDHCRHLARKPQVLVVDDEPAICALLSEELSQRGMKVYSSSDSTEALRLVASIKLDVVISDIRMPGLDGLTLLREVRKTHHYFPSILFVSGFSKKEALAEIMDMGAVALLEKPIDMDRLFALIMEQLIEGAQDRNRYVKSQHNSSIITINETIQLDINHIGFGGAFIPHPFATKRSNSEAATSSDLQVGNLVSFRFYLDKCSDESPIQALGEVAWKRDQSKDALPFGLGIKFLKISEADHEKILNYVRLHHILSFIPLGVTCS